MNGGASWTVSKHGVATWVYALDPADPAVLREAGARGRWLAERIEHLVGAMPPFAEPGPISVCTDSDAQEPAFIARCVRRMPNLLSFVRDHADVWSVSLDLLLQVELLSDQGWYAASVVRGAHALIYVETQHGVINEAKLEQGMAVWLSIDLDAELYAPQTFAAVRDNGRLAKRNGLRLTAFLQRVESELPARFLHVESQSFRDQAHRHGLSWRSR
jgi:hypothetical protein